VTAVTAPAHAQIVNVQSILATDAEPGLSGSITGTLDWRTGNIDLLLVSLSPVVRYRSGRQLIIGTAKGELGQRGGETIIKRTFEHARYRYAVRPRLTAEVFAQHAFDEFRRLELRALVGAGPLFHLIVRERSRLSAGVAYMFEYEVLDDNPANPDAGETDIAHRLSTYVTGSYQLKDDLQIVQTVYLQPRLNDVSDARILSESQLVVQLTKKLSITTSLSLAYDSEPPDGVDDLDTALKASLTFSF
jgi:hypothetical protein